MLSWTELYYITLTPSADKTLNFVFSRASSAFVDMFHSICSTQTQNSLTI